MEKRWQRSRFVFGVAALLAVALLGIADASAERTCGKIAELGTTGAVTPVAIGTATAPRPGMTTQ
jgi:hypothetical protein